MIQNMRSSHCALWMTRAGQILASAWFPVSTFIGLVGSHWTSETVVANGVGQSLLMAVIRLAVMAVIALRRPR